MTYQPPFQSDAAVATSAHPTLMGHADALLPESATEGWIGYESCHPLTWLPISEPEIHSPR